MYRYFIKFVIFSVLISGLMACSSVLDKKYNPSSREKDFEEIGKLISAEDFKLLKDYVQESETENKDFSEDTYQVLLNAAKVQEKIRIDRELYLAELEKQKAAEKVIIQQKTELLCSRKWKMEDVEIVIERTDDSVMVMSLSDAAKKAFTGSGKRRKIYLSDGTYKEMFGREEAQKGTWEFTSPDVIRETRPAGSSSIRNSNVYLLSIETLDEKQFRYIQKAYNSAYASTGSNMFVTMVVGD